MEVELSYEGRVQGPPQHVENEWGEHNVYPTGGKTTTLDDVDEIGLTGGFDCDRVEDGSYTCEMNLHPVRVDEIGGDEFHPEEAIAVVRGVRGIRYDMLNSDGHMEFDEEGASVRFHDSGECKLNHEEEKLECYDF